MYIKSAEFMAFPRILCYSISVTECEWRDYTFHWHFFDNQ